MDRWNGCVALVIEAASGIGAEICRMLVKYPITVIGIDGNIEKIYDVAREEAVSNAPGHLIGYKCNLLNEEEIMLVFGKIEEDFGQIDICINNASFEYNPPLIDGNSEDWWRTIEVIMAGDTVVPSTLCDFYSAVEFMVKTLADRLRKILSIFKCHIQSACISPGLIKTGFEKRRLNDRESSQPAGVAESVLYILSTNPRVDHNDIPITPVEQKS